MSRWARSSFSSPHGVALSLALPAPATQRTIGELAPQTDAQRSLKARAIQVSTDVAQTRLALFVQLLKVSDWERRTGYSRLRRGCFSQNMIPGAQGQLLQ